MPPLRVMTRAQTSTFPALACPKPVLHKDAFPLPAGEIHRARLAAAQQASDRKLLEASVAELEREAPDVDVQRSSPEFDEPIARIGMQRQDLWSSGPADR